MLLWKTCGFVCELLVRPLCMHSLQPLNPKSQAPARYIIAAAFSLFLGCGIYTVARPQSLLMFRWFDAVGLHDAISSVRGTFSWVSSAIPAPVVFSAPLALWVFSYCLLVRAIWYSEVARSRHIWFWCLPAIAVLSELGQAVHLVPGTFDLLDLCTMTTAPLIAAQFP